MKKVWIGILVAVMLLTMLPFTASAAGEPTISWTQSDEDGTAVLVAHVHSAGGLKTVQAALTFDNTLIVPLDADGNPMTLTNGSTDIPDCIVAELPSFKIGRTTYNYSPQFITYTNGTRTSVEITLQCTTGNPSATDADFAYFYFAFASGKSEADMNADTFKFMSLAPTDPIAGSVMDNSGTYYYYASSSDNTLHRTEFPAGNISISYTNSTVQPAGELTPLDGTITAGADLFLLTAGTTPAVQETISDNSYSSLILSFAVGYETDLEAIDNDGDGNNLTALKLYTGASVDLSKVDIYLMPAADQYNAYEGFSESPYWDELASVMDYTDELTDSDQFPENAYHVPKTGGDRATYSAGTITIPFPHGDYNDVGCSLAEEINNSGFFITMVFEEGVPFSLQTVPGMVYAEDYYPGVAVEYNDPDVFSTEEGNIRPLPYGLKVGYSKNNATGGTTSPLISAEQLRTIYYNTQPRIPMLTVTNNQTSAELVKGIDYEIVGYKQGTTTLSGPPAGSPSADVTYKAVLQGIGAYTSTLEVEYKILKPTKGLTVTAQTNDYTGQPVPFLFVKDNVYYVKKGSSNIQLGLDVFYLVNGAWTATAPTAVGTYNIRVQGQESVPLEYRSVYGEGTYTIQTAKQPASVTTAPTARTLYYTGQSQDLVNPGVASGGNLKYRLGTTGSYMSICPLAKDVGTYYVYYMVEGDANHTDLVIDEPIEVKINLGNLNVNANGYTGTYDGAAHGITVSAPEGATVKYGTSSGTYNLTASPTRTDAGSTTVYYQVTKENYTTVTGSKTITINKADINPSVSITGWHVGKTANAPTVSGNTGNGAVTYKYCPLGGSYSSTVPTAAGSYTVQASIAATTNYNAATATASFTISDHSWNNGEVTTAPTCSATGVKTFTCTVCGATKTETVAIDPNAHSYGAWTQTTAPTCTEKGVETRTCAHNANHKDTRDVNALGHDLVHHDAKAATCETAGNSAYWSCGRCNKYFSDANGTTEIAANSWVISATGHNWNSGEVTTAPTCSATGTKTFTCTVCGATRTETIPSDPNAHSYGDWTQTTAPTCTAKGVETRTCAHNANHKETRAVDALGHNLTAHAAVAATCETAGNSAYWSCSRCNKYFSDADGTHEIAANSWVISATGHSYGVPTYTWSGDNSTVTATRTCANNTNHKDTETVNTSYSVVTAATCENAGTGRYSATFTNSAFTAQTKDITIPVKEHTPAAAVVENRVEPTCTAAGHYDEVVYCSVCNAELSRETKTIAAKGHDLKHHDAKAATCTEIGWNTYDTCSRCDYTTYEEISALGHSYGEASYAWAADNSSVTATRTCSRDASHVETETVNTTSEVTVQPTCETKGKTTYTATFKNTAFYTQTKTVENIDALGHDWEAPTYVWNSDNTQVTATRVCKHDGSHVETETVGTTSSDVAATCEEDGLRTYTSAAFKNAAFTVQTKTEILLATGHNWNDPTYAWAEDNSTVTATRTCKHDPSHIDTETVNTTSEVTKAATCEAKGETTYTAGFTNAAFKTQTKTVENIDALGHVWEFVNFTWADSPISATAHYKCGNNSEHTQTIAATVTSKTTTEPTCTETGIETYTASVTAMNSLDGKAYSDNSKTTVKAALGHSMEYYPAVPATCTATGNVEYYHCTRCNKNFADQAGTQELSEIITPMIAHTYTSVVTAPTCTAQGYTTHTCSVCGDSYVDNYTEALGHDYQETWTWAEDYSSAELTLTCRRDANHVVSGEDIQYAENYLTSVHTEPTHITDGSIVYTAEASYEDLTYTDTKTVFLSATGHVYGEPVWNWSEDYSTATATFTCTDEGCNDEEAKKVSEATISTKTVAASCTATGKTTYTATVTFGDGENNTYTDTKEVEIPMNEHALTPHERVAPTCKAVGTEAYWECEVCHKLFSDADADNEIPAPVSIEKLDHDWGEGVVTTPATCTAEGVKTFTCTVCGATKTEKIDKIAHTPGEAVRENEVAATCTAEGSYDEVVYCTVCGEELSREAKAIAKLAHTPAEAVRENVVPATCKDKGSYEEVVYCSECNAELSREQKTIDKLTTHTPGDAVHENEVPATCSEEGSYDEVVYCTVCDEELSREAKTIKKLAHTPAAAVRENEVPATCTAEGSYDSVVYCSVCHAELSRKTEPIEKSAHTPGAAVRENITDNGFDEVVYCTECSAEVSRKAHEHNYYVNAPMWEWRVSGSNWTAYARFICPGCGDEVHENATITKVEGESEDVYTATCVTHSQYSAEKHVTKNYTVDYNGVTSVYEYGAPCRLNADAEMDWYVVDGANETLMASKTKSYAFIVTRSVKIVARESAPEQEQQSVVSAQITSDSPKTATFRANWVLADGSRVTKIMIYRGNKSNSTKVGADLLVSRGTKHVVNMTVTSGSYTLNLSNLTTGKWQNAIIVINYVDAQGNAQELRSEVVNVQIK